MLTYKTKIPVSERPQITCSRDAYNVLKANWSEHIDFVEEFNILLLDRSNRVMGIYNISKGGVSGTIVDAKIIFAAIIKSRASGAILAHNHPSGNLRPSTADIEITNKLKEGAKLLDIVIHDHLIVTRSNYYSFGDNGFL